MVGRLLLRGLLVGLLAGLCAFGTARWLGEPPLAGAIAFEEAATAAQAPRPPVTHSHADAGQAPHTHDHAAAAAEPELVSRATQAGLGLLTGLAVYGAAVGGLFALVFAFAHGRVGPADPRMAALWLAVAAFLALVIVPGLKYPANPPSVGQAATIGLRTQVFFLMLAASIASLVIAVMAAQRLRPRIGHANAIAAGAAVFCVLALGCFLAFPTVDEVPDGFPASLLWNFRVAFLAIQLTLWGVLGIGFGIAAERLLAPRQRPATS